MAELFRTLILGTAVLLLGAEVRRMFPKYPAWMGWTGIVVLLGVALPLTYPGPREAVFSLPSRVIDSVTTANPELVWTHPTLSAEEQRKAIAECKMETLENSPDRVFTRTYMDACLTAEGLVQTPKAEE